MRAVLIVNPQATGTTARTRDVLATALAADLKVEMVTTERRGHATEIARDAVSDGVDYVVALGGDGTLNEVVNGILFDGAHPDLPALGIVPGGCTNVLARSLGLPTDPVEATSVLLDGVRAGRSRPLGLGLAHVPSAAGAGRGEPARTDRWFTFCAGLGLDAATVRRVETKRKAGTRVTPWRYARAAMIEYLVHTDRSSPALTLSSPGHEPVQVCLGLVCNTAPWTYLGARAVDPCPQASFDSGLDVFGLRRMHPLPTMRTLGQLFGGGPHGRRVVGRHDLPELTLSAAGPLPLQVDGDFLGETAQVTMRSVPRALRVVVGEPDTAG
ncbi:MAG TPA: diacylglycerol kinase family protein [Mycobacteriales bacterium]|jgi:diacylglycerol kinase family enzyme|nr:diacylglycerol kinase family protein [Mycobacteriales bacterium]